MKSKNQRLPARVELGRVTLETKGGAFGTIEQVGLYQPAGIADR